MFYVYILFSEKDKQLYAGFTDNLRSRVKTHENGFVKSTKHRLPSKFWEIHQKIPEFMIFELKKR